MKLEELEKIIIEYMDSFNTMTLSCVHDGAPWSAPVYYARQGLDLIFFSSSKSAHSQALELNPQAAVSIYDHYQRWQDIRGLQISGQVSALQSLASLTRATKIYLKRHPFAAEFFSNTGFIADLLARRTRVMLYLFKSQAIHYLDNSQGFGVRWRMDVQDGRATGIPVRS